MVTAQQQLNPIKSTLWLKLDEQHISSGINKTHNYGRSDGTPHEIQVGDGITTATFPLCATPKGFEFSDGYYLSPNIDLGTEWSISFHVNYNGANNEYIVGFSTGGGILLNDNAATNYLTYYDGTSRVSAGAALGRDRPYHVCVTKSAANSVKIYIDGILKATAPGTVGNTVLTRIGCSKDNTFYSHAVLLNFEAFKYELNSTQVVSLKNRLSRENITGGTSLFNPAMIPGCILHVGAYEEARATKAAQPNLLDGACEDVTKWLAYNSGTLSNQPGGYAGNCMRAAYNGVVSFGARQPILTAGYRYLVQGRYRADGVTAVTPVLNIGTNYAIGQANNAWQAASLEDTCTHADLYLFSSGTSAGYVEFDSITATNLSLTSYLPRIGAALTQATPTAMPWRGQYGITCQGGDLFSWGAAADSACMHNGTGGTLIVVVRPTVVNTANWIASTFLVDAGQVGFGINYDAAAVTLFVGNGTGVWGVTATSAQAFAAGSTYVLSLRVVSGANATTLRVNGTNKITATLANPSAANPVSALKLGAHTAGNAHSVNGAIPDALLVPRVLTDAECLQAERFMYTAANNGVAPPW